MKYFFNFLVFFVSFLKGEEESCGYFGNRADKIEK